jgi:hypothetical protein
VGEWGIDDRRDAFDEVECFLWGAFGHLHAGKPYLCEGFVVLDGFVICWVACVYYNCGYVIYYESN